MYTFRYLSIIDNFQPFIDFQLIFVLKWSNLRILVALEIPCMSSLQNMVSFSVPDHLSQDLASNLAGPSPLGTRGVDSLSQV